MSTQSVTLALLMSIAAPATLAAQDILAGKPVYPLGEVKTWTSQTDVTYTMIAENLEKLTQQPTNVSNIYLFPEEGGGWNTDANRAIGIQGFYVDMESIQNVGTVTTTWEGAAANAYDIYLTDTEPTIEILSTTPTYSASGLGQYQSNVAMLPDGSKGRYLVFQPTDATNWGWGVKIRSISATAPQKSELSAVTVNPQLIIAGETTDITFNATNQFGQTIPTEDLTITVSDNAVFSDGKLTILSGETATFTVEYDGKEVTKTVYVATVPPVPAISDIRTAVFTNGVTDYNGTAGFVTAYNGAATNLGLFTFPNGEVAQGFADTRCVFFYNTETTGAWNGSIDAQAGGYNSLCLDIFATSSCEGYVEFEGVTGGEGVVSTNPFTLKEGEWNHIVVNVAGATRLNNMSVRFNEANANTLLLSNIYFTPAFIEGDETAPVISNVEATPSMTSVQLEITATDDLNDDIQFTINDGEKDYSLSGKSGETVTYTVTGLQSSTEYEFTVTASDGKNISEATTVKIKTLGLPDAPTPDVPANNVKAIFSAHYDATTVPTFDAWGSTATASTMTTESGETVLAFNNYLNQWGGLVNIDLSVRGMTTLHVDIFGDATPGTITIAPVWDEANGANTPGKTLNVKPGEWNSYDLVIYDFGFPTYGKTVNQIALTESTLSSFNIDNLYFWYDPITSNAIVETAIADTVEVYTIQGIRVAADLPADRIRTLPAGLYIVKSANSTRKVIVK